MSIILIMGGIGYAVNLNQSASQALLFSSSGIGPAYFPNILAGLLVILSVMTLVKNLRDKSPKNIEKVTTHNSGYILVTVALMVAFLASWQFLGFFYLNVFVLLTVLMTLYRIEFGLKNSLLVALATSVFTTGFLYGLFGQILALTF
ncbi:MULTISPECIES: tripartite tricarboxylate transporter TctB family protein [Pacificibacter]|uniref:tripartite tricarboxylate transporter TctB family protein n=1 Tax=Pacificibacter TaxID=1042323 RepID=UPI001C0819D6|nr:MULTISPECIES: tripartite tricarboxylate transporter TctB family protein [Pacificibacter]MBU2937749.1 tripartite tricarboxylate transporter TctB family protein [Pacificibacter marinus]MDO6616244.1 tripartite tricarboxylate transporter TctB family protein [Pacificibacter sp. 1_MG-2023]